MGWNSMIIGRTRGLCRLAITATGLLLAGNAAYAQFPGGPGTGTTLYNDVSNAYFDLEVGLGTDVAGSFGLISKPSSPVDPGGAGIGNFLLWPAPLVPATTGPSAGAFYGSWLFVRVDGGAGGPTGGGQGGDYIWGDSRTGFWIIPPTVVGTHMEAKWQTKAVLISGAGGGFSAVYNPAVEVDLITTFVHDTVRFEFNIKNNDAGATHTVGLVMVQDINVQPTDLFTGQSDGPIRLPNQPYLHHEALLTGAQVPQRWESFVTVTPATPTEPAKIHSLRGTLKPLNGSQVEPTPASRFAYGQVYRLNGFENVGTTILRNFEQVWNFVPDPSITFDKTVSAANTDAAVAVYWDEQQVQAGQTLTRITFLGNADAESDISQPLALSVSAPIALSFTTDRSVQNAPVAGVTPNPFTITAYVQNLTDLTQSGGKDIGPVNLFLDLPKGLVLDPKATPAETASKQIPTVGPGSEGSVSWSVKADGTASGPLTFTVTAAPSFGNGKSVQDTLQVPSPPSFLLRSNPTAATDIYQMLSFPLIFGNATPTQAFSLPPTNTPSITVLRWNTRIAGYESVNAFTPGLAYWIKSTLPTDTTITLDVTKFPPLDNSVQPGASTYRVDYPVGWNQIGDPYVYSFRFSELQVFDSQTLQLVGIETAADPINGWILPAVYRYDTSDPSPQNWHYVLTDNLGFTMKPFDGFWIYVKRPNLQFLYPGADTPGGQVTRAALVGAGLGAEKPHNTASDWRVQLTARGHRSMDVATVGVAPKATDAADSYKYNRPPALGNTVGLNITHPDWKGAESLMQDLRAPATGTKTWDVIVSSPKPSEDVTISWPDVSATVPRTVHMYLVDKDGTVRQDMRTAASYTVNTGASATRHIQVVAQPVTRAGAMLITSFDVVAPMGRTAASVRSVTINYALSQAAETHVIIRDGAGRIIRTLSPTRSADSGTSAGQAVWDMRDNSGASLSAGTYSVELNATGPDGQRARQIRPFLITR